MRAARERRVLVFLLNLSRSVKLSELTHLSNSCVQISIASTCISSDLRDEARDLLVESVIVATLYCFVRLPEAADFEANGHAEIVGCF